MNRPRAWQTLTVVVVSTIGTTLAFAYAPTTTSARVWSLIAFVVAIAGVAIATKVRNRTMALILIPLALVASMLAPPQPARAAISTYTAGCATYYHYWYVSEGTLITARIFYIKNVANACWNSSGYLTKTSFGGWMYMEGPGTLAGYHVAWLPPPVRFSHGSTLDGWYLNATAQNCVPWLGFICGYSEDFQTVARIIAPAAGGPVVLWNAGCIKASTRCALVFNQTNRRF